MSNLKQAWRRVPVVVRRITVAVAGSACIAIGLALLVLPGPGWAAIFVGFAILSTEFRSAQKVRDRLVAYLHKLIIKLKQLLPLLRKHKRQ